MKVGETVTMSITGKIVKKELYKDDTIRLSIQNDDMEVAVIKEEETLIEVLK